MAPIRFGHYRTGGGSEMWIARGSEQGPRLLIVPPLFEEANRCRALLAETQRGLAEHGIGSALIDLPGTGDSERPLSDMSLDEWCGAVADAAAAFGAGMVASVRGGGLIDHRADVTAWWRFSPVDGAALVRDLDRAQQIAGKRDGEPAGGTRAGYPIADAMISALRVATPEPVARLRTLRLETEAATADARVSGPPLWRRPEPEQDLALARRIVDDLAGWIATCAA